MAAESEMDMAGREIRAGTGDADPMSPVYEQLRSLARKMMGRERPGQTLQTTALVHEAYVRLSNDDPNRWNDRKHFYIVAAQAMRRILIDRARRRRVRGEADPTPVIEFAASLDDRPENPDLVDLDDALKRLTDDDPRAAQLVTLRFFAGLSLEDAAETLGVSRSTAKRDWSYARAWLRSELDGRPETTTPET